jgi:hypothetical protein
MLSEYLEVDQKPLLPSRVPDMFSISDLTMVESTSTSSSDLYPFDATNGSPPIPSIASDPTEKRLYLKHNFCQLQDIALQPWPPLPVSPTPQKLVLETQYPQPRCSRPTNPQGRDNTRLPDIPEIDIDEITLPLTESQHTAIIQHQNYKTILSSFSFATPLSNEWKIASPSFGMPPSHPCNIYLREDLPNRNLPLEINVITGDHGFLAILGQHIRNVHYAISYVTRNIYDHEIEQTRIERKDSIRRWILYHFKDYITDVLPNYRFDPDIEIDEKTNYGLQYYLEKSGFVFTFLLDSQRENICTSSPRDYLKLVH